MGINKNSGIYAFKNVMNNKMYIGSSVDIYHRKRQHLSKLRRNLHHNLHLQRAWNLYGEETFEFIVLQRKIPTEDIYKFEKNFIIAFDTLNNGYNQCLPNENGSPGFTEETIEKLRRISYQHHHGETSEEEYQIWLENKNKPRELIGNNHLKKGVVQLNRKTGKVIKIFESRAELEKGLNLGKEKSYKYINKPYYKDWVLVCQENYDENKDYRYFHKYEKHTPYKRLKLKMTCTSTGNTIICDNMDVAIRDYGLNKTGMHKVLYGSRKSHKGYRLESIR